MTFDESQAVLDAIRRNQGTHSPLVCVEYSGTRFRGRVVRCDSDPEHRERVRRPYGLLVLQDPSLANRPDMMFQIADLNSGAIRDEHSEESEDSNWSVTPTQHPGLRHAS